MEIGRGDTKLSVSLRDLVALSMLGSISLGQGIDPHPVCLVVSNLPGNSGRFSVLEISPRSQIDISHSPVSIFVLVHDVLVASITHQ